MNILSRVSRLFKADIHGILDNLEQPEIILQQSVRDMQTEIEKAVITIAELDTTQDRLEQQNQSQNKHIKDLQDQLQFCLAESNESLGKSVVRKKLQAEVCHNVLTRRLTNITADIKLKIEETEERKEKLQAIRDKLSLFTEKNELNECSASTDLNSGITQDDVELAFLYAKQNYAQAAANGEK